MLRTIERTDGRTESDVITKTKISCIDGLPYSLTHGAPRARLWPAELHLKKFGENAVTRVYKGFTLRVMDSWWYRFCCQQISSFFFFFRLYHINHRADHHCGHISWSTAHAPTLDFRGIFPQKHVSYQGDFLW